MKANVIRSGCLLLATLLLFPMVPATPTVFDDDAGSGTDAGDSPRNALAIEPGTYTGRVVGFADSADVYQVEVAEGQGVRASIRGSPTTPFAYLSADNSYSFGLRGYASEGGTWYLTVAASLSSAASDYAFTLELVDLPLQDDAGSGRDAHYAGPVAVERVNFTGTLNEYDWHDRYTFNATAGETLFIDASWHEGVGGPNAWLYGYTSYARYMGSSGTTTEWLIYGTGEYRLDVNGNRGNYTIAFGASGGDGGGSETPVRPANDDRANATAVASLPSTHTQPNANSTRDASDRIACGGGDTSVWYKFTPTYHGLLTVDTYGSDFDTVLRVEDEDGRILACNDNSYTLGTYSHDGGSYSRQSRISQLNLAANTTYYVQVSGYYGATGQIQLNFGEFEPIPVVDLRVEIESVERNPVRTDVGEAPNLVNERRVVVATVTNEGPDALKSGSVELRRARGHVGCDDYGFFVGAQSLPALAPGESTRVTLWWDTTTSLGDQTLIVRAAPHWPAMEQDPADNRDCVHTFVRVGGLGGFA